MIVVDLGVTEDIKISVNVNCNSFVVSLNVNKWLLDGPWSVLIIT